jgi:hypothetical protein
MGLRIGWFSRFFGFTWGPAGGFRLYLMFDGWRRKRRRGWL